MAYSYNTATGTGSAQLIAVPEYIDQAHIFVSVNGVDTLSYTWTNANQVSVTAPAGATVRVYRKSSPAARVVDFIDGMSLSEAVLDSDSKQAFFLAQEQLDATDEAVVAIGSLPAALALMANETGTSSTNVVTSTAKAAEAAASATAALASQNAAAASETNLAAAAATASVQAGSAVAAAATATTKAAEAAASASAALTSETAAAGSASSAASNAALLEGYKDVAPNAVSVSRSLQLGDRAEALDLGATGLSITVEPDTTVDFPIGAVVSICSTVNGTSTLVQGAGVVLHLAGTTLTGNRTLGAYCMLTLRKVAANKWLVAGAGAY